MANTVSAWPISHSSPLSLSNSEFKPHPIRTVQVLTPQQSQLLFFTNLLNHPNLYQRLMYELSPISMPPIKQMAFSTIMLMLMLGTIPVNWKKSDHIQGLVHNWSYSFLMNKCLKKKVWKPLNLPETYPRKEPPLESWSFLHTLQWIGKHSESFQESIWNTKLSYEQRTKLLWKTILTLNLIDPPQPPSPPSQASFQVTKAQIPVLPLQAFFMAPPLPEPLLSTNYQIHRDPLLEPCHRSFEQLPQPSIPLEYFQAPEVLRTPIQRIIYFEDMDGLEMMVFKQVEEKE
ncbi:hypothetical protein HMI54_001771 [Coelomomyces lativittatus]|nr:hypothetical protein HMI55_007347 [Coelomomyces lativittatus]KAJ1515051.1 hypothetical protein HMI56_006727 [Coelomomyces lativittatus]KAJ1518242.1 hypothetical protein HMI54_001771 [Coelomomyces lativittatus]